MSDTDESWSDPSDGPPAVGFVVHQVNRRGVATAPTVWAWCRVELGRAGYTEITFTKEDGYTPADPGEHMRLGAVLFQVWC